MLICDLIYQIIKLISLTVQPLLDFWCCYKLETVKVVLPCLCAHAKEFWCWIPLSLYYFSRGLVITYFFPLELSRSVLWGNFSSVLCTWTLFGCVNPLSALPTGFCACRGSTMVTISLNELILVFYCGWVVGKVVPSLVASNVWNSGGRRGRSSEVIVF